MEQLNRSKEYLDRETLPADWWQAPHTHVLGGRDLQKESQGTWLGITRQGRIAVLTNFREEGTGVSEGARSRGEIAKSYLTLSPQSDEDPAGFAKRLVEDEGVQGVGGFSLIFGRLRRPNEQGKVDPLGIISNRTADAKSVIWTAGNVGETFGQTCALSNSHYGDNAWPKVVMGEEKLSEAILESEKAGESVDGIIQRCFDILCLDTLPKQKPHEEMQTFMLQLRNSIFIPAIGNADQDVATRKPADEVAAAATREPVNAQTGKYGTHQQTVILVDEAGRATFVERTLYEHDAANEGQVFKERKYVFDIDGWADSR